MSSSPEISIIIPTHQRESEVVALILSLLNQSMAPERYEILVVSNFPHFSLEKKIHSFVQYTTSRVRFLCAFKQGVNWSRNKGIEAARGAILVFLDDDCLVEDTEYLNKVAKYHQDYPEAVGIGGYYEPTGDVSQLGAAYFLTSQLWLESSRITETETQQLVGGNASYKKTIFDRGFRFNPNIVFGGAEAEFNARLTQAKNKLLIFEDLTITHNASLNFRSFCKKAFRQGLGFVLRKKFIAKVPDSFFSRIDFQDWYYNRSARTSQDRAIYFRLLIYDFFYQLGVDWKDEASRWQKAKFTLSFMRLWFRKNKSLFISYRWAKEITGLVQIESQRVYGTDNLKNNKSFEPGN
jgi:glycosyltransferase involved in cell wall biosynthesis